MQILFFAARMDQKARENGTEPNSWQQPECLPKKALVYHEVV